MQRKEKSSVEESQLVGAVGGNSQLDATDTLELEKDQEWLLLLLSSSSSSSSSKVVAAAAVPRSSADAAAVVVRPVNSSYSLVFLF